MSIFKKTKAEEVAERVIGKVAAPVAAVLLLGWVAVIFTTPATPEELEQSARSSYLTQCERWGINFEAHELGGESKYKDRSLLARWEAEKMQARNPALTSEMCEAAFEAGVVEGRRRVDAGKVAMR
ncbi:hypothetical protein [Aeromonas phage Asp37]|nr:hypothetical protein [Aeromonas phage Asp37]